MLRHGVSQAFKTSTSCIALTNKTTLKQGSWVPTCPYSNGNKWTLIVANVQPSYVLQSCQQTPWQAVSRPGRRLAHKTPATKNNNPLDIDNYELVVGDCVALTCFALYKQIASIVLSPGFPGWFAPLSFNPLRFAEFANFAGMLLAAWVVAAGITGGYRGASSSSIPLALQSVCRAWLVAMPVAASQLVLVTAAESQALVGDEYFASALPLAASGPGEPLTTAAGVLGVMAIWRAFYTVYLNSWNSNNIVVEAQRFRESLATVALVAAACSVVLQLLQLSQAAGGDVGNEMDYNVLYDMWGLE
eukprot:GHRR01004271.1.p1 GENE.GHRR01004271.1~~GHRR01004271.1.p1  ORF type:complete len:303 (+),score=81.37 GHRR01004271.1:243-1151(+)